MECPISDDAPEKRPMTSVECGLFLVSGAVNHDGSSSSRTAGRRGVGRDRVTVKTCNWESETRRRVSGVGVVRNNLRTGPRSHERTFVMWRIADLSRTCG